VRRIAATDRRKHPRFPELLDVHLRELQAVHLGASKGKTVMGRVHNLSQGGLCFISSELIPQSTLVRCCIGIAESPISIPTLMQVRWVHKQKLQPDTYLTGLQFVF
jgi:hypothetical protein